LIATLSRHALPYHDCVFYVSALTEIYSLSLHDALPILSHPAPVFHGDTLYAESEVLEVRPSQSKPDRGVVKVRTDVYNQRNELRSEEHTSELQSRVELVCRLLLEKKNQKPRSRY